MAKKRVVKSRVEKPYNHGTMSESAFWGMIRSALRQKSRWWKPISEVKKLAKRTKKDGGRQKFEYQCAMCKGWFKDKEVQVDHIEESGALKGKEDVGDFIVKLFCEVDGLQVLCNKREDGVESCHRKKTNTYMKSKKLTN